MRNNKVLVIEDDPNILENIGELLTDEGYVTMLAKNAEAGIAAAKNWQPDIIVCDIIMPGADGFTVLNSISASAGTQHTPFIFLTARVNSADLRAGMEAGADDYIFKPYTADELLRSIKTQLLKREQLIQAIAGPSGISDTTLVRYDARFAPLPSRDIKFITAENQYSCIGFANGKKKLIRKTLTDWENLLPADIFLRIHRGTIINTTYIIKYFKNDTCGYQVFLQNERQPFAVSKRFSSKARRILRGLPVYNIPAPLTPE